MSLGFSDLFCNGHMDFRHLLKHNLLTLSPVSERVGQRPGSLVPVFTGDFYQPLAVHLWHLHAGFTCHLYFLTCSAFAKLYLYGGENLPELLIQFGQSC